MKLGFSRRLQVFGTWNLLLVSCLLCSWSWLKIYKPGSKAYWLIFSIVVLHKVVQSFLHTFLGIPWVVKFALRVDADDWHLLRIIEWRHGMWWPFEFPGTWRDQGEDAGCRVCTGPYLWKGKNNFHVPCTSPCLSKVKEAIAQEESEIVGEIRSGILPFANRALIPGFVCMCTDE